LEWIFPTLTEAQPASGRSDAKRRSRADVYRFKLPEFARDSADVHEKDWMT